MRTAVVVAALVPAVALGSAPRWQKGEALPLPRTEVAAARSGNELVVVGGYVPWGDTSAQADAYSPAQHRWRRLPDLPQAVNHAMADTHQVPARESAPHEGQQVVERSAVTKRSAFFP